MAASEWAGIRVFMRDRQKFLRDAASVSAATRAMGSAADMYSTKAAGGARSSFLWNQALFTLRRTIYTFTIAAAGAVTAVGILGFKFDMMRENSQVAFTTLLNSASAARTELNYLFELAAQTPFEFQNIQQFARQFLGWGFSLRDTNRYLKDFANVIAAMGGDVSIMDRISLAFGQIRSSGVLLGQDLRQLQQAIPGVAGMLQRQLHLTPRQMGRIGALRIPSNIAIEAIMRGIESDPRFANAAKALQGTVQGQLSTLHDYASRLFGDLMMAPFEAVRGGLPRLNAALKTLSATMSDRGWAAFVNQLDEMAGAGGHLADLINAITGIFSNGARIVAVFGQSVWDVGRIALPLVIVGLQAVSGLLGLAADHGTALRIVLDLLIARFVIIRGIGFLIWLRSLVNLLDVTIVMIRTMTAAEIINTIAGFRMVEGLRAITGAMVLMDAWMGRMVVLSMARFVAGLGFITGALAAADTALGIATASIWGFTTALLANPITWIVLAVIALIAGLVILYMKWQAFHDFVDRTVNFVVNNWPYVMMAISGLAGPITILIGLVGILWRNLDRIVATAREAYGWITRLPHTVAGGQPSHEKGGLWGAFTSNLRSGTLLMMPGQAEGGFTTRAGWSMIGEQGPELMWMQPGAHVVPLDRAPEIAGMGHEVTAEVPVIIKLDSTVLAEAVAKVMLRQKARA